MPRGQSPIEMQRLGSASAQSTTAPTTSRNYWYSIAAMRRPLLPLAIALGVASFVVFAIAGLNNSLDIAYMGALMFAASALTPILSTAKKHESGAATVFAAGFVLLVAACAALTFAPALSIFAEVGLSLFVAFTASAFIVNLANVKCPERWLDVVAAERATFATTTPELMGDNSQRQGNDPDSDLLHRTFVAPVAAADDGQDPADLLLLGSKKSNQHQS